MDYKLQIIFGKNEVDKYFAGKPLSQFEKRINSKVYRFVSEEEKNAFVKGIQEAVGWTEYFIVGQ